MEPYLIASLAMLFAYFCNYYNLFNKLVVYSQRQWFVYNNNLKSTIDETKTERSKGIKKVSVSVQNEPQTIMIDDENKNERSKSIEKLSNVENEPPTIIVEDENENKEREMKERRKIKICEELNTIHHYYYRVSPTEEDIHRLSKHMSLLLL